MKPRPSLLSTLLVCGLLCSLIGRALCQVRSSGENGANRRVESPVGYNCVAGYFQQPQMNNLRLYVYSTPVKVNGQDRWTKAADIPQMYVGPRRASSPNSPGALEVDAGLTWETSKLSLPDRDRYVNSLTHPNSHWTYFYRANGGTYGTLNPSYTYPGGNLPKVLMGCFVLGGKIWFFAQDGVNPNAVWSFPIQGGYSLANHISSTRVKRIIAMTQQEVKKPLLVDYDGSDMLGATFSEGVVGAPSTTNINRIGSISKWSSVGGRQNFFPFNRYGGYPIKNRKGKPLDIPLVTTIDSPWGNQRNQDTGNQMRGNGSQIEFYDFEVVSHRMYKAAPAKGRKATYSGK